MNDHRIAVYGASGYTGRQVVEELARKGAAPILVGRDRERLEAVSLSSTGGEVRTAALDNPAALTAAFEGCAAVVNAAGPFAESAGPVVGAALEVGAHYLDFTAEQEVVVDLFDSWDEPARRAGVAVVPAMGFYGALGDLLATLTAGESKWDRVTIAYAVDGWLLTSASRRTVPLMVGQRRAWRDGELVLERGEPRFGTHYYAGRGSVPVMEDYPLPEAITVPRHIASPELRLLMTASTLQEIFAPDAPQPDSISDESRGASRFLVTAEAEGAGRHARTVAVGQDIYGITAPIIAEGAIRLVGSGLSGALAPAEAFQAAELLQTLAPRWLTLEPRPRPSGERPADATGFVLAAERATNERDAAAAAALYAEDATLEMITDGQLTRFHGSREIAAAWQRQMQAIEDADLLLRKQLLAAETDAIFNEWHGAAGAAAAYGTEAWFFDPQGKVREHRLLTSLDVRAAHPEHAAVVTSTRGSEEEV